MFFYLFILFFALVNLFFIRSPKIKAPSLIVFCFMFFLCAFRAENIGTDTHYYIEILTGTKANAEEKMQYQLLFRWLVLLGRETSTTFFFFISAVLTYFPLLYVLRKENGRFLPVALLLFVISMQAYFINSFNIVRQVMATVFILCSFSELNDKNYFKCLFWYVAAVLMHTISIAYLPFMLLAHYKISYKKVVFIVFGSLAFAFVFAAGFDMRAVGGFFEGNEFMNLYHFIYYFEQDEHYEIMGMIKQLIPTAFICLYSYKVLEGHLYCRLYLWGLVFLCLASPFSIFALRFSMGLYATELFIIPMLYSTLESLPKRKQACRRFPVNMYMGFLTIYFLYTAFVLYIDDKSLVPYKFFFE